MEFIEADIPGCFEIQPRVMKDRRGYFVKNFQASQLARLGLETEFKEDYFSLSEPGVLRGMHFQVPPADHAKIVCCLQGEVMDVVVDLRKGSPTFGEHRIFQLSDENMKMLYLPKGMAHGFYVPSRPSLLLYKVSTEYDAKNDSGVLWSSLGINWPNLQPIISDRDQGFLPLSDFDSPFVYTGKNSPVDIQI